MGRRIESPPPSFPGGVQYTRNDDRDPLFFMSRRYAAVGQGIPQVVHQQSFRGPRCRWRAQVRRVLHPQGCR